MKDRIREIMGIWCNYGCDDKDFAVEKMEKFIYRKLRDFSKWCDWQDGDLQGYVEEYIGKLETPQGDRD